MDGERTSTQMEVAMLNGVNSNGAVTQKYVTAKTQEKAKVTDKNKAQSEEAAVVLDLGKSKEGATATYSKPVAAAKPEKTESSAVNAEEINKLWEEANRATQNLRDLVEQLLKSQGKTFKDVLSGKEELIVDEKTRAAAQQAISEDGESGVKAVSDRIVAFAKAISNDNPEKYDELMKAIDEGFAKAEKALGGELPEICKKTREEINRKMEEWKSGKETSESAGN